nr:MAG TPA: hypothetical protein [Caudoviricetes sp.]
MHSQNISTYCMHQNALAIDKRLIPLHRCAYLNKKRLHYCA